MAKTTDFLTQLFARALHVFLGQGGSCIYQPTCSHYSRDVFIKYGLFKGTFKTLRRVLRCHPFAKGGLDPA